MHVTWKSLNFSEDWGASTVVLKSFNSNPRIPIYNFLIQLKSLRFEGEISPLCHSIKMAPIEQPDQVWDESKKEKFEGWVLFTQIPSSEIRRLKIRKRERRRLKNKMLTLFFSFAFYRKAYSEYFDPCQDLATRSLKCLHRNGGNREMCSDYFQWVFLLFFF